ncbi:hypothetical protein ISS37_08840 [candidate division KSB1 bacterium]|nr:hypothetical protein [candidate division KSB1 bacterium]
MLKIDAIGRPVEVVGLEGETDLKGIAGFTGKFRGWFSTEGRAVSLLAKIEVSYGNITIELEEWDKWKNQGYVAP